VVPTRPFAAGDSLAPSASYSCLLTVRERFAEETGYAGLEDLAGKETAVWRASCCCAPSEKDRRDKSTRTKGGRIMPGKAAWRRFLVLCAALLLPNASLAGPFGWFNSVPADCPPGAYSPVHYCAPALWKVHAKCHGIPGEPVNLYADESTFQVTPQYLFFPSHCPSAPPDGLSDYGRALPSITRMEVTGPADEKGPKEQGLPQPRPVEPAGQEH
jgi:hypothetical protein